MPRRPADLESVSRADMVGDDPDAPPVAVAPRPALAPVVLPPPATESVGPVKVKPSGKLEIPGLPFPEFCMKVLAAQLGGPLGMATFNSKVLFTEAPRMYRKLHALIARGCFGDYDGPPSDAEWKAMLGSV